MLLTNHTNNLCVGCVQTDMTHSESIKNLAAALIKFHKGIDPIRKDSNNPFFKSKYASLSTILGAIDEPLALAGLGFTQFPTGENELTTLLVEMVSGEWIKATYKMTPVKNDPQGQGSCLTYMRRYALSAVLGLATEEDDDGNAASSSKRTRGDFARTAPVASQDAPQAPIMPEVVPLGREGRSTP